MSMSVCVGNIGSGKSLFASKLAKKGQVVFNMDSFQQMLAGGEYGLYDPAKKKLYQKSENFVIKEALVSGLSVVIDRTNMDKKRRQRFIEIGKKYTKEIICYDWGAGNVEGLMRRQKRSLGVPASKWAEVWAFMEKNYEQPSLREGFSQIIEMPPRYRFYAFDFDGTIVQNKFPDIGEIIPETVEKMNKLWEDLANIIIVWSCRTGEHEDAIRQFILKNKIPFDFINENLCFETGSRKIFAHEYYDDRSHNLGKIYAT
jgi:predicted kinase